MDENDNNGSTLDYHCIMCKDVILNDTLERMSEQEYRGFLARNPQRKHPTSIPACSEQCARDYARCLEDTFGQKSPLAAEKIKTILEHIIKRLDSYPFYRKTGPENSG